jgi:hypothetical protein
MIRDEKPSGIPFALPHPSRKFFQLFTLSIGVFDLIQLLESISECKEENTIIILFIYLFILISGKHHHNYNTIIQGMYPNSR